MFLDFSQLMNKIFTKFTGNLIGIDEYGNKYYQGRLKASHGRLKRWVIYNGIPEASKVPPQWFGWLHYMIPEPLNKDSKYDWQQEHSVNLTGTKLSPKHIVDSAQTRIYNSWKPHK